MTLNRPKSPVVEQQELTLPANSKMNAPYPPRCSLDLRIITDDNKHITDRQLRLESFQGHEAISQPFEYNLVLRADDYRAGSTLPEFFDGPQANEQAYGELLNKGGVNTKTLDFSEVLGANSTIILGTPETDNDVNMKSYPSQRPTIFFNGIITNFALAERGVYHATIKPALFKLSLQNNYRLFSQKTILQVVTQVLEENNISFNKADLNSPENAIVCGLANYRVQDWLQAGESDLDFINRLMQKVNLFYYFIHQDGLHTMVITDQPYYKTIYQREVNNAGFNAETEEIKSLYLSYTKQQSLDYDDRITEFKYQQNLTSQGITSVLAQTEAVWESQNTAQVSPVYLDRKYQKQKLNMQQMHKVQYGASREEATRKTETAMKKLNASRFDFSGSSTCADLKAGHKFKVLEALEADNPQMPIRPELNDQEFVVTSVQHQATATGDYQNSFSAVTASGLATPSPAHDAGQGTILAKVTKKPTQNVETNIAMSDSGGFEEVDHTGSSANQLERTVFTFDSKQFSYDDGQSQKCTGVYVRFIDQPESAAAQWVKLAEHMQTVPEVGVYVVVSRSQDETEVPEIQQILQSKGSKVIMPQGYTCNTNVGDSYNTSYGDSAGIHMGADITTSLSTAQDIVNPQYESGDYNNVSYGESSSYNYNVTSHSHNFSVTGDGAGPSPTPSDKMNYVQYSHAITYGDAFSKNETYGNVKSDSYTKGNAENKSETHGNVSTDSLTKGNAHHKSKTVGNTVSSSTTTGNNSSSSTHTGSKNSADNMNGAVNSASNTNGTTNSAQNFNGVSNSVNVTIGMENSASTKTGSFNSATNINGLQLSGSIVTGASFSNNKTLGNNSSTTTVIGNHTATNTTVGNTTTFSTTTGIQTSKTIVNGVWIESRDAAAKEENDSILAWAKNQMAAAKTGTNTTASTSEVETTASDASVETKQADNSISSTTAKNTVSNVSAGTDTANNSAVQTKLHGAPETEIATMKTIL